MSFTIYRHSLQIVLSFLGLLLLPASAIAADAPSDTPDDRIDRLERTVEQLQRTVKDLTEHPPARETDSPWRDKITFGMYGEIHANFDEGANTDRIDFHRIAFNLGIALADWIQVNTEVEIEHALVEDGNGELELEQCYFDFSLHPLINLRAGRFLTPVGLVNLRHEPMHFNGVERPMFETVIVPSTWWSDGAGFFGTLLPEVKYQAYIVAGLDGSGIDPMIGIREARQEQTPGLNEAAFTGRLDFYPFARAGFDAGHLRFGVSTFMGGVNNGNDGIAPGLDASVAMYAADGEYSYRMLDLRAEIASLHIYGASRLAPGVASEIFGWNLELAAHLMPAAWKIGKLEHADLIVFARFDAYDTQHAMPNGVARNPAGDRTEWTVGVTLPLTANVVAKFDYQFQNDATSNRLDDLMNFGLGWEF